MELSEAQVKQGCEEYLQYAENQEKLVFLRLNAGDFIEVRGGSRRRIKGCPKGTADYLVLQGGNVQMFYLGQPKGKAHPIAFVTFIEIKSSRGKQREEQREFELKVNKCNCRYYIVRSVEELITALGRE